MSGKGGSLDTRRVPPIADIPSNLKAIQVGLAGFFWGGATAAKLWASLDRRRALAVNAISVGVF